MRPTSARLAWAALAGLLLPASAVAQISGEQAVQMADAEKSALPPDTLSGGLMFGLMDEDIIIDFVLRLSFDREMWGLGLQLPLRFRIDRAPDDGDDFLGLRNQDWDEVSDFLRLLRYVYVGQADKKGPFYVRVGELNGLSIGHGTIMHRYYNVLDLSTWHTGLNAAVNVGAFGGEAMVGDVLDPYVAGLRFTVRPLQLALGEGFWEGLVVGASLMTDSRAPFELSTDENGAVLVNDKDNPIVTRERTLAILGLDVGLELLDTGIFSITPYTDLNNITNVARGWGLHLGILWQLSVPLALDSLVVDLRTEYRRVSGDYVGPYFDTIYETERYQLLGANGGLPVPKLRALCGDLECQSNDASGKNGIFLELLAGLPSFVFIGGEYLDYDGGQADGRLRLSLEIPALDFLKLSAFYYRVNVEGLGDLFALDDKSAIIAQASIPIYFIFSLQARWWRVWEASAGEPGGFQSVDNYSFGIGFSLEL